MNKIWNTVIVLLKKYQVLFNLFKVWNHLIKIKILIVFSFISEGVLMSIECKAWAKNIKHNSMDRQGSVHFELMMTKQDQEHQQPPFCVVHLGFCYQ